MERPVPFGEIVEAADELTIEDQETLLTILKNRLRDRRRAELVKEIQEARKEFEEGRCRPATPDELMREISS
ncbi:MAG: hypothetical protein A3H28_04480 [Acidobacteria bacterium RIFCSPLOWO2_02_FULL_61_28]|nr:MAG: hypothetical protein A3H28_04480 [Acidobacteria bacterium RIFCSPLOWO2_02_FULL_61_28]